ncbi:MAG: energy transducer TonB [Sphingomicrobium sp.]
MLAYAPRAHREAPRPRTLILILAGHALLIGAVMSAKMDLPQRFRVTDTLITNIPLPHDPPPPARRDMKVDPHPAQTSVAPLVDTHPMPTVDQLLPHDSGTIDGAGPIVIPDPPNIILPPPHQIVRTGPKLATAEDRLRPPYPAFKRDLGEEATLTLKLSIDDQGRVTAVEPVGHADPAFLDSARRHLIRAWRFEPATEDGHPVASTRTITLRFELGEG